MKAAFRMTGLPAIIAAGLTFIVYLPALSNDFVNWDDPKYVLDNPFIRSLSVDFFRWAFSNLYASNWHPLTWISHALDYALWGLNPRGHHLSSVILHSLNTMLVVLLVAKLMTAARNISQAGVRLATSTGEDGVEIAAMMAGLLFGLHPIHVESVAWVSERKDVLCAFWYLLSVLAYVNYLGSGVGRQRLELRFHNRNYLFSAVFFVLALLSKPMAVTLPVVLLILEWYPFRRIRTLSDLRVALVQNLPFFLLSLASAAMTLLAQQRAHTLVSLVVAPLSSRMLVAMKAPVSYLEKMILPVHLMPLYPYPRVVFPFSLEYLLPIMALFGITLICVATVRKSRLLPAIWGYYLAALVPVLGLVQVGEQAMADRYTYLPSLGPFLAVGVLTAYSYTRARTYPRWGPVLQRAVVLASLGLLVALSSRTRHQIRTWENGVALWTSMVGRDPDLDAVALPNRGAAFLDEQRYDLAIADLDAAIAASRKNPEAFNNRGVAYSKKGRHDEALADFTTALAMRPDFAGAYTNRGLIYNEIGLPLKAIEDLSNAVALGPQAPEAYYNRGGAYARAGQHDRALRDFSMAIALKSDYVAAYNARGLIQAKTGRLREALADFEKVQFLDTGNSEAFNNRGIVFSLLGQDEEALADYARAIAASPNRASPYINRSRVYLRQGNRTLAEADLKTGCALGDTGACRMLESLAGRRRP